MNLNAPFPTDLLRDRIILVTGASKGLGRAVAKAFAEHQATVILTARSVAALESLYDEILAGGFPKPALYPLNLTTATPLDYLNLQEAIQTHFGRLDGILLNAGMLGTLTPLQHYPIDQWYQVLQTNLSSAFSLIQATLPLLKNAKEASILFTLAEEGLKGKAYWGAYGVSKFGLNGLMQILAEELETNTSIRVNSITPPPLNTALRKNAYPAADPKAWVEPFHLLSHYLYLMGPGSQGITGKNFNLCDQKAIV